MTALVGLVIGFMVTTLGARFFDMSTFTPRLPLDDRPGRRDRLLRSSSSPASARDCTTATAVEDAIARAIDTAGRAVMFAGTVVAIALLGLLAIGHSVRGRAWHRGRARGRLARC